MDHRSGLSVSVARGTSYQVWWAPDAFCLIWKKEKNESEDPAKPRISNRQLSVNSGTLLRYAPSFRTVAAMQRSATQSWRPGWASLGRCLLPTVRVQRNAY